MLLNEIKCIEKKCYGTRKIPFDRLRIALLIPRPLGTSGQSGLLFSAFSFSGTK